MKFNYIPHQISKDGDHESIRLTLAKSYAMDEQVTIEWTRTAKTDWAHATLVNAFMAEADAIGGVCTSIGKFCKEESVDINDPNAFLLANEKNGGEMFVRNASGAINAVAKLAKNADNDEYITTASGMKKRYQCFAADEDNAQAAIAKLILGLAKDQPELYDDLAVWGKAGHPLKKVEKKDALKIPDLNVYCKRGQTRPSVGMRIKAKKADETAKA